MGSGLLLRDLALLPVCGVCSQVFILRNFKYTEKRKESQVNTKIPRQFTCCLHTCVYTDWEHTCTRHFSEASEREWPGSDSGTFTVNSSAFPEGLPPAHPQPHVAADGPEITQCRPSGRAHRPARACASRPELPERGPASRLSIQHSPPASSPVTQTPGVQEHVRSPPCWFGSSCRRAQLGVGALAGRKQP